MFGTALLLAASMVVGQADGQEAFDSFMKFSIGGTWTTTKDGMTSEISYKRILNGKFVHADLTDRGIHVTFLIGIDPATKKCTWWGFDENGVVVKWVMSKAAENAWTLEGKGMGPNGECALKEKATRIDDNTVKVETEFFLLDGKKQDVGTVIFTRKGRQEKD